MLTEDENIIDVRLAVQYKVKSAQDYVFNVRSPDVTLKQSAESALRSVIGKNKMDFVLTEGRSEVVASVEANLQAMLDDYKTGLVISSVNLVEAQPPKKYKELFLMRFVHVKMSNGLSMNLKLIPTKLSLKHVVRLPELYKKQKLISSASFLKQRVTHRVLDNCLLSMRQRQK